MVPAPAPARRMITAWPQVKRRIVPAAPLTIGRISIRCGVVDNGGLVDLSGLNIADIFETVAGVVPDAPALIVRAGDGRNEVRLSFAELDARVNQLAHVFLAQGVKAGDHVGTHLYDGNQYVEVTLAAYKVRAVPVNVNFRYVDEELTYLFDNADLKLVVTEPDLEERAARAAATLA